MENRQPLFHHLLVRLGKWFCPWRERSLLSRQGTILLPFLLPNSSLQVGTARNGPHLCVKSLTAVSLVIDSSGRTLLGSCSVHSTD
jgi:hypothetical protein